MFLQIILDKSTFQSLSLDEIVLLHNYYRPNITPILTMEILADLKKDFNNDKDSNKRVIDFAKKLLPYNSSVNIHFMELLENNLLQGDKIDYTPVLGCSQIVKTQDGQIGFHFKESPQEKAIKRWKEGSFLEAERELASIWREYTTQKDLLENLKENLKSKINIQEKFKSLDELNDYIDSLMNNESIQLELLYFILSEFNISADVATKAVSRWFQMTPKSLNEFAPYAFFCCKVKLLFNLALRYDLVGTRPTNILDLEYLYYIPFSRFFASSDNFQKRLAPYLLDSNQEFIDGMSLKNDLKYLVDYRKTLSDKKDIERTQKEPPRLINSLTYKMWNKYFNWPPKYKLKPSRSSPEDIKKIMDDFINATKADTNSFQNSKEDINFVVREHSMRVEDLCLCGSGKMFKDCCLPKDYFEKQKQ